MASEPPFFHNYTKLVTESDVVAAMQAQLDQTIEKWKSISEAEGDTVHPPYTWSIKEALGHLIDTEIVFAYRAFRFSRKDQQTLNGFDQDLYIANGNYGQRTVNDIMEQLASVRRATILLFRFMDANAWKYTGSAAGLEWSVTDLARAIVGHVRYHESIINRRLGRP